MRKNISMAIHINNNQAYHIMRWTPEHLMIHIKRIKTSKRVDHINEQWNCEQRLYNWAVGAQWLSCTAIAIVIVYCTSENGNNMTIVCRDESLTGPVCDETIDFQNFTFHCRFNTNEIWSILKYLFQIKQVSSIL